MNASNFFAKGPDGQKLPATILPANDATFAWLFFTAPMPGGSQVQVTVDGATIPLAAATTCSMPPAMAEAEAGNSGGLAGGRVPAASKLTFDFSTVSLAPLANTTVWGRIVDPGPDLLPHTADDSMTEDDIHLLPIAGVKVFLIGLGNRAVFTDAASDLNPSPDRFAHEPEKQEKQETDHRLTAAITGRAGRGSTVACRSSGEREKWMDFRCGPLAAGAASHGASRNCTG